MNGKCIRPGVWKFGRYDVVKSDVHGLWVISWGASHVHQPSLADVRTWIREEGN